MAKKDGREKETENWITEKNSFHRGVLRKCSFVGTLVVECME